MKKKKKKIEKQIKHSKCIHFISDIYGAHSYVLYLLCLKNMFGVHSYVFGMQYYVRRCRRHDVNMRSTLFWFRNTVPNMLHDSTFALFQKQCSYLKLEVKVCRL